MRSILSALLLVPNIAAATGSCAALVPASLNAAVDKAFPEFRTPRATDNLAEDVEYDLRQGRKGCLGVAIGDFDGDGIRDRAIGLTARKGNAAVVVVALARGKTWGLHTLSKWPDSRGRLYVAADRPGVYSRTEALDRPLETGEVDPMHCPHSVVVFGLTESSGVAFCYKHQKWEHVWISD